jgi:Flp pilus assembly pilin Flp
MLDLFLRLRNWFESELGQDLIEYALLLVFIVIVVIAILPLIGSSLTTIFSNVSGSLGTAAGS